MLMQSQCLVILPMIRDVELLNHLPLYIQQYREIDAIMTSENPEFQLLCDTSEQIKDNQFITTCDATGISFFESLLGITPSSDDTLESRIQRVLVKWNDQIPYTYRVLLKKLTQICGAGNFTVTPDWNNYTVTITTSLSLYGAAESLDDLLDYIMPANLVVISQNELERSTTGVGYHVAPVASTKHLTIDTKTNTSYSISSLVSRTNVVSTTRHRIIN